MCAGGGGAPDGLLAASETAADADADAQRADVYPEDCVQNCQYANRRHREELRQRTCLSLLLGRSLANRAPWVTRLGSLVHSTDTIADSDTIEQLSNSPVSQ